MIALYDDLLDLAFRLIGRNLHGIDHMPCNQVFCLAQANRAY